MELMRRKADVRRLRRKNNKYRTALEARRLRGDATLREIASRMRQLSVTELDPEFADPRLELVNQSERLLEGNEDLSRTLSELRDLAARAGRLQRRQSFRMVQRAIARFLLIKFGILVLAAALVGKAVSLGLTNVGVLGFLGSVAAAVVAAAVTLFLVNPLLLKRFGPSLDKSLAELSALYAMVAFEKAGEQLQTVEARAANEAHRS
jgi:hypothetical protein